MCLFLARGYGTRYHYTQPHSGKKELLVFYIINVICHVCGCYNCQRTEDIQTPRRTRSQTLLLMINVYDLIFTFARMCVCFFFVLFVIGSVYMCVCGCCCFVVCLSAVALIHIWLRQCATKLNEQQLIVPVCIISIMRCLVWFQLGYRHYLLLLNRSVFAARLFLIRQFFFIQ